jgi:hypothetical protein
MSANHRKFALTLSPEQRLSIQQAEFDALQRKHTKLAQDFEAMYTTVCTLARHVDALRDRVGHALAAVRGFPESIHVDEIPEGCLGWGMSEPEMPPCQYCPYESDCFEAGH